MCRAFVLLVILAIPVSAVGAPAHRRILTLRSAERSIDLAWQAELEGDYAGARKALVEIVSTSTSAEEVAAKARLEEWLAALDAREALLGRVGKSPAFYSGAHATLKSFGLARSDLLWARALTDVPGLAKTASSTGAVSLHADVVRGPIDRAATLRLVEGTLDAHGLKVSKAEALFEARVHTEASTQASLQRGFRAGASVSIKLRERGRDGKRRLTAHVDRARTEMRNVEVEAQRFALRRAIDDAAEGLVFHIRARLLDLAARPDLGVKPTDKQRGARL